MKNRNVIYLLLSRTIDEIFIGKAGLLFRVSPLCTWVASKARLSTIELSRVLDRACTMHTSATESLLSSCVAWMCRERREGSSKSPRDLFTHSLQRVAPGLRISIAQKEALTPLHCVLIVFLSAAVFCTTRLLIYINNRVTWENNSIRWLDWCGFRSVWRIW